MRGRAEAHRERHNEMLWLAWHAEAFARGRRLPRKVPQIQKPKTKVTGHVQSREEVLATMRAWVQATNRKRKAD